MRKSQTSRGFGGGYRYLALVLTLMMVGLVILFALATKWTWAVDVDDPQTADAVVVLAYGTDRINKGVELVEDGIAPVLVLSISNRMDAMMADGRMATIAPADLSARTQSTNKWVPQCGAHFSSFDTVCFNPMPHTTVGEALAVRELAQTNGWDSVVIVTEPSHLNRSRAVFEECSGVTTYAVASDRSDGWFRKGWRTAYEVGALSKRALTANCS